jgi:hypothetical protein
MSASAAVSVSGLPALAPDRAGAFREILCVIAERTVGNDNTITFAGCRLQLPASRLRPHFVKASVRVHEYPDQTVSAFLGPHRLANYAGDGTLLLPPDRSERGSVLDRVKGGLETPERVGRPECRPPLTGLRALPRARCGSGRRNSIQVEPRNRPSLSARRRHAMTTLPAAGPSPPSGPAYRSAQ